MTPLDASLAGAVVGVVLIMARSIEALITKKRNELSDSSDITAKEATRELIKLIYEHNVRMERLSERFAITLETIGHSQGRTIDILERMERRDERREAV